MLHRCQALAIGVGLAFAGSVAVAASDLPVSASPAWLAQAQREIAAREYRASRTESGLQAPNRAHDLRTYFEPTGIRVQGRTAHAGEDLLRLSLAGVGRNGELAPIAPGIVTSDAARVEIRRNGLLEWYENSPAGLEQGFEIAERPTGDGPLILELALSGATASPRGDALVFTTRDGRRLSYANLIVSDASGRSLTAHLAAPSPQRVQIVIEEDAARYPLVIDPLLTQTADTQLESDQASREVSP